MKSLLIVLAATVLSSAFALMNDAESGNFIACDT